jgi:hypothetical protein
VCLRDRRAVIRHTFGARLAARHHGGRSETYAVVDPDRLDHCPSTTARTAPSPDYVLGWKILSSSPAEIVIGVEGSLLTAQQVVEVQDGRVVHATVVRYKHPAARALWGVSAPIHVRTIPHLMEHTLRP